MSDAQIRRQQQEIRDRNRQAREDTQRKAQAGADERNRRNNR